MSQRTWRESENSLRSCASGAQCVQRGRRECRKLPHEILVLDAEVASAAFVGELEQPVLPAVLTAYRRRQQAAQRGVVLPALAEPLPGRVGLDFVLGQAHDLARRERYPM